MLNAHYTSPTVIRAIYETIGNMGFTAGNILEPSCGVGNFLGLLPESMAASRLYGVELDSITGRIAKQLYPQANITVAGFETFNRPEFSIWLSATCRSAIIRSTTELITSSVFLFITIFSQKHLTSCIPAGYWHSSPAVTRWIRKSQLYGNTWPNAPIC